MLHFTPTPRHALLSRENRDALPPVYRLDATIQWLQDNGKVRILIALVDKWAAVDEASPLGRIAQSRALVRLGLVDRAWARLQELSDSDTAAVEVLILTTELFLARQWTQRARSVLEAGLERFPNHSELQRLLERISDPATEPNFTEVTDDCQDVSMLAKAAHHHMATGAHVKARLLLDRGALVDPSNQRIADMRWGLDGDFSLDTSLSELVRLHGPDLSSLAEFEDEPDHTESVSPEALHAFEEREVEQGSFPNLFRNPEPRTDFLPDGFDDVHDEVTMVSSMVNLSNLDTLAEPTESGPEHTEIQRVIRHDHEESQPATNSVFRLNDMSPDFDIPEFEDEDVIVRVHGDHKRVESNSMPSDMDKPLVISLDPTPSPANRLQPDECAEWAAPAQEMAFDSEAETKIIPVTQVMRPLRPGNTSVKTRRLSWWFAALAVVFLVACILLALGLMIRLI